MRMMPIASGSSGNCIYLGTEDTHVLFDAGISRKRIEEGLNTAGLSLKDIDAIFVTHEHIDHTKGLGVISRKDGIPIYSTSGTIEGIEQSTHFVYHMMLTNRFRIHLLKNVQMA